MNTEERILRASDMLKGLLGEADTAIVLGSGLGEITSSLENAVRYSARIFPGILFLLCPVTRENGGKAQFRGMAYSSFREEFTHMREFRSRML